MESIFSKEESCDADNDSTEQSSEITHKNTGDQEDDGPTPPKFVRFDGGLDDNESDENRDSDFGLRSDSDDDDVDDSNLNQAASALEDMLNNSNNFKAGVQPPPALTDSNDLGLSLGSDMGLQQSSSAIAAANKEKKKEKSRKELEEEEREKMQVLVSNFTEDQLDRYEMYRRAAFPKAAIKRVMQTITGCSVSQNVVIAMSGIAKVFIGEVVEEALDVMENLGESGPLQPKHLREAVRRLRLRGAFPHCHPQRIL